MQKLLSGAGITLPLWMSAAPSAASPGTVINLPAVIIVLCIMYLLVVGIRESARFNAVQVGAFASESLARSAANEARRKAPELATGLAFVTQVQTPRGKLFRARVGGLSQQAADNGCDRLTRQRWQCAMISPDAL